MEDLKPWWSSKAIWTGIIGSIWGVAGAIGILPQGLIPTGCEFDSRRGFPKR
jgi:hypothetical protein